MLIIVTLKCGLFHQWAYCLSLQEPTRSPLNDAHYEKDGAVPTESRCSVSEVALGAVLKVVECGLFLSKYLVRSLLTFSLQGSFSWHI